MTRDGGRRQQKRSQSLLQAQLWRGLDLPMGLRWPWGPSRVGVGRPWGPAQRGSGDSRIQQRGGWGSPGPGGGANIRVGLAFYCQAGLEAEARQWAALGSWRVPHSLGENRSPLFTDETEAQAVR